MPPGDTVHPSTSCREDCSLIQAMSPQGLTQSQEEATIGCISPKIGLLWFPVATLGFALSPDHVWGLEEYLEV